MGALNQPAVYEIWIGCWSISCLSWKRFVVHWASALTWTICRVKMWQGSDKQSNVMWRAGFLCASVGGAKDSLLCKNKLHMNQVTFKHAIKNYSYEHNKKNHEKDLRFKMFSSLCNILKSHLTFVLNNKTSVHNSNKYYRRLILQK